MPRDISAPEARAPELPEQLTWLNCQGPLGQEALRGKVILLDFWSYASVESQFVAPQLRALARKHPRELIVIGVHQAGGERPPETDAVRRAIARLEIEHPVVIDHESRVSKLFGVRGAPVFIIIDPRSRVRARSVWTDAFEAVDRKVAELIAEAEYEGTLSRLPVAGIRVDADRASGRAASGLLFPGAVLADAEGGRLFVADSGHHRIIEADLETGVARRVIGMGQAGLVDGRLDRVRFRNPRGLALEGDRLYAADAGNHVLREVDLRHEFVRTVAGTGERSTRKTTTGARRPGRLTALDFPWGLALAGETLYFTVAGSHQIWRCDLETDEVSLHAGTGSAGAADGPHLQATLIEPRGIATDGRRLYFTDRSTSSVRAAGLGSDGEVETLGGAVHPEGAGAVLIEPLFRSPLGIVWRQGFLYVVGACDSAVCSLDLRSGDYRRLMPVSEKAETAPNLWEAADISAGGDYLYVADTNNHRVLRLRAGDGVVTDWGLTLPSFVESSLGALESSEPYTEEEDLRLPEVSLGEGSTYLHFDLRLPPGHRMNRAAPFEITANGDGEIVEVPGGTFQLRTGDPSFPVTIPLQLRTGAGALQIVLVLYYCEAPEDRLCYYQSLRLRVPIRVSPAGKPEARVRYQVQVPVPPI